MNFRLLATALAALTLAACSDAGDNTATPADPNRYTITGDLSAVYRNGEFVVWVSEPKEDGAQAGSMMPAASMSGAGSSSSSMKDGLNIVAETPIVDGKVFLEGTVETPRNVYFYVLGATSPGGMRMAPVKGQSFVLEPGDLTLTMNGRARFIVEGGHYNDIVVNSWRLSPEYLEHLDAYNQSVQAVEGETEDERRARVDRSGEIFNEMLQLENQGRQQVALAHEDPLARKLTIQSTWLRGPWITDAVRRLAEMLPDDPWVIESLASEEDYAASRARADSFAVGTQIRDFEAETLDGETVSISGAREGKDVILLEFWASWCGPCRAEIPHMKQAYAEHGPKGFEIFSFTVDDEREDWEEASLEEDLPWIDAGMGMDHPATEAYGVTGVPANFLVDARSGEIVAKNLRGHKLDEALEERFATSNH